ncbi:hypothetical protein BB559_001553 [Furculomyces boomerangus]|uniref:Anaphase-promoting complex subunit 4 WD40 domain-containing protein n=2 Tax=Harpellales TaxID=61421 RepID=A0A2T9Z1M8_9FUNG|nr:hypothetical protein BB559_001553 [Furculomyces boomerangus]PVZ99493.1 hypothetical protein BB558_004494 [Smittium angustum]
MNLGVTEKDLEISQPPQDTVSELTFSSQADYIAASSWDNSVRIWEIQQNGTAVGKAMYSHEGPALCCAWSTDGTKLVSGGADKAARLFDISTGKTTQVAAHDGPIRCVKFLESPGSASPILATGSWDKTLRVSFGYLLSQTPISSVELPERCYTMDVSHPLMVVGTADRHIWVFDLNNPTVPFKKTISPLKYQTRAVSCFTTKDGFSVGSIEGRVGIQYIQDRDSAKNFSFKCHRDSTGNIYAINSISHHPIFGTFCTGGSDGSIVIWDKDARSKLKNIPNAGAPIVSTCFNRNGQILAYAAGYDWSKGYQSSLATDKRTIYLHAVKEEEVKPKKK